MKFQTSKPGRPNLATLKKVGAFSLRTAPFLQTIALAMLLMCLANPAASGQKPELAINVSFNNTEVYVGCTEACVEFVLTNYGDEAISGVDLRLYVNSTFASVTNTGDFTLNTPNFQFDCSTCSPPTFNNVSDFYDAVGLTIQPGVSNFKLCFKLNGGVPNSPLFHFAHCVNGVCINIQEMQTITPISTEVLVQAGATEYISNLDNGLPLAPNSTTKNVVVRGTLIIDTDYEFMSNNFMLDNANANIVVQSSSHLKLTNEHVFGCEEAWKGITVQSGAKVTISGGGSITGPTSLFEDAEVGVTALNGSTVNASNTKFLNNRKGIRVPAAGSTNNVTLNVSDNSFEVVQLKSPLSGSGFAGLDLNNLYVAVVGRNIYKNMNYGIYGTNTNLFTSYDEFSILDYVGIAMTGSGHFLYQVGKGNSLVTPTFSTIPTGIRTFGMSVYATSNGMTNVTSGVRAFSLNNKDAFVFNNSISAVNNGILISSLRPLNHSTIENNTITMNGNVDGRGINSISSNVGTASYLRFNDNTINVFNATYGMDMVNNRGVQAQGNHINLNNTQAGFGIAVSGGQQNHLLGNYLDAASLVNLQYGISVGQSLQGEYGCNYFDGTRTGLWFTGPNASSDIAGNDFNGFLFGLQVGNGAAPGSQNLGGFTGTQIHRGNLWNSAPVATGFGAIHYSQDIIELQNSRLFVNPVPNSALISTESVFVPNQTYFVQQQGSAYTCPTNLTDSNPSAQLGSLEQGIASGNTTVGTFAAENWTAKRQLYRLLKANPSLAPQGSVYASFLSSQSSTTVGKFEDLQINMDDMLAGDANSRTQLSGYVASMEVKFGEAKVIEDGLIAQPGNSNLLAQRSAKQAEIVTLAGQSQALEQSMLSARVSSATQLLATNAAITTTSTHEANQKTANRILLETVANGQMELTTQQVADLAPIAVQCPYSGGEGVYAARGLLGNETAYNDFTACGMGSGGGQFIKAPKPDESILPSFSIYPNPANDYVIVQLEKKLDKSGSLTLTNTLGVQVLSEKILEGTEVVPLDTEGLPAGTYFLTLQTGTDKQSRILVISR